MLGIFIGYMLGVASAIGIWFYLENAPSPFLSEEQTSVFDQSFDEMASKKPDTSGESAAQEHVEQKTRFDFYDILSNEDNDVYDFEASQPQGATPQPVEKPQETARLSPQSQSQSQPQITVSPSAPAPQPRPSSQNAAENYFLQVGSFRSHAEADNLKARLALLGVMASVQSADLAEKGRWYRVRVGPYNQKTQVDRVQVTLRENGIDAQLIRIR